MKNFVRRGDTVEVAAPAELSSGDLFAVGSLVLVAVKDAASGATVEGVAQGVVNVDGTEADEINVGDPLFYASGAVTTDDDAGSNPKAGLALSAKAQATAGKVDVLLAH